MKFDIAIFITEADSEFTSLLIKAINQGSSIEDRKGLFIISAENRNKLIKFVGPGIATKTQLVEAMDAAKSIIAALNNTSKQNEKSPGGLVANKLIQYHLDVWKIIYAEFIAIKVKYNQYEIAKNGKLF